MAEDHVDHIVGQWAVERPDVDASPIQVVGRISRLSRSIDRRLKDTFNEHGLEAWEYDLLASLRRSGPPYALPAGELLATLMITSGAVTNRIDRLAARGLVERGAHPTDKRIVLVRLTDDGRRLLDRALPDHLANEESILAPLSAGQRRQLIRLLRTLQTGLDGETDPRR